MKFKTIKDVPIVSTGTYSLGSGEATFTPDDLASAVLAAQDPTVRPPRIKIGHEDPRFAEAAGQLDGEPAMGVLENMALANDGHTITADLAGVPEWLADGMETYYPNRSIEGGFNYVAPSGKDYKLVISNLALLGTTHPGIGSLPDLRELLERNGEPAPEPATASGSFEFAGGKAERFVMAKVGLDPEDEQEVKALMGEGKTRAQAEKIVAESTDEANEERAAKRKDVKASVDLGAMPRRFAADVRSGKVPALGGGDRGKWWTRSVEASDEGALSLVVDTTEGLVRLPITVADRDVTYGAPEPISAAGVFNGDVKGPRVLASFPSNPVKPVEAKTMKIAGQDVEQSVIAKSLGLDESADEKAILEKLGVKASTGDPDPAKPAAAPAAKLPEGVVAIDAEKLAELERGAQAGATVAASLADAERDGAITEAIKGGRIAAGSRESWVTRWNVNPEETRKLLTAPPKDGGLAPVIPVQAREMGVSGDGSDSNGGDADYEAIIARHFPELATTTGGAS